MGYLGELGMRARAIIRVYRALPHIEKLIRIVAVAGRRLLCGLNVLGLCCFALSRSCYIQI